MSGRTRAIWRGRLFPLGTALLVLFLGALGARKTLLDPGAGPSYRRYSLGELVASARVCQTFVAEYEDLSQVEVRLANSDRNGRGAFLFHLYEVGDGEGHLFALLHDASAVIDNAYYAFVFPPIPDSAGRTYRFCLEAPEAELETAIAAVGIAEDAYRRGAATFRDMWHGEAQDLDFQPGYRLSAVRWAAIFGQRLSAYKPSLFGSGWLYLALGLAYLVLLTLTLALVVPGSGEGSKGEG